MTGKIKEQIISIRSTGLTNMFDVHKVSQLAKNMGYYDLLLFLQYNRAAYVHFILTGEVDIQ